MGNGVTETVDVVSFGAVLDTPVGVSVLLVGSAKATEIRPMQINTIRKNVIFSSNDSQMVKRTETTTSASIGNATMREASAACSNEQPSKLAAPFLSLGEQVHAV